ncbi:peptidase [Streptomyces sp. CS113]|uniref:S8 family serine peptidase n=1 Tax=Streptomyces sp. CS113 TaxID=1982761 RepID=UPI000B41897E|nr:S8 family serine peptidase [Streptomyces sp. CS113]OWA13253.1 peptidase [Streptomyces sp. CS113]
MKQHPRCWSVTAVAAASVLVFTGPFSVPAVAGPGPAPALAAHQAPSSAGVPTGVATRVPTGEHTVTLITGDVVTTRQGSGGAGGTVTVRDADGKPARSRLTEADGNLFVYPESALPFVAKGSLDRELFNVTGLIEDGYDDASRERLPLIVSYRDAAAHRTATVPDGARKVRDLASVQGTALSTDRTRTAEFWRSVTGARPAADGVRDSGTDAAFRGGVAHIWLDATVEADLADSTAQIGAPRAWAGGNTGQGVEVAVLDTGVDAGHPDLADRIAARQSFVPDENTDDHDGHGTHVASTIAGTGAASDGKEKGVAPGARLSIGKVLDNSGRGQISWTLAAMEWATVERHAKIVNMSLGSSEQSDGSDPMSQAVDRLSAETGALFVVAAGNGGEAGSIGAPGVATSALTVGAVDATDTVAPFSSQGPRVDGALKPEITAPGVGILAANSSFAAGGSGAYQSLSGTSMATPHVAGAAALLAAARPDLTGSALKDVLASSSHRTPQYDAFQAGSGRVDVDAAVRAGVYASATAYAPGGSPGPVRRPVTYTNTTGAAVTLDLSVAATHAPEGMFRLSASRVTVPAHGTADVTLTIDGSGSAGGRAYSGQILATDADARNVAHTAVSAGPVRHKLTVHFKDADGNPVPGVFDLLKSGDSESLPVLVGDSGTAELYLPEDTYSALAFKTVPGVHGPHSWGMALLGDPEVRLTRDTAVTFDASRVERIETTVPQRTEATYQRLDYQRSMGGTTYRTGLETQTAYDSLWAQPTTHKVTHGDFLVNARWRKEQPALTVSTRTTDFTDVLRQDGVTALPKGTRTLPLVFAGDGAAAEYARLDARGKAVVVRRDDDVADGVQAANAVAAGAALLLVVNNEDGRALRGYGEPFGPPVALDVALLSTDEGEKLAAQAKVRGARVTVASQPVSPYVYDLLASWHNEIPARMTTRADSRSLARVDVAFDSPLPDGSGGEFRYDWIPGSGWTFGGPQPEPVKGARTDWVSTGDHRWNQEAYAGGVVYEIGAKTAYRPGSRQSEEWFGPVERPHLNDAYRSPLRIGDSMAIDVPAWGSRDHIGLSQDDTGTTTQHMTLSQGGTTLGEGVFSLVEGKAPGPGKLPYRLVVTGEREAPFTPYSSATRTQWDFVSAAAADPEARTVLPLVQLDYRVDVDGAGRAKRHATVTVTAAHLPGAAPVGHLGAPTLELSYDDGRSWHRAARTGDGGFRLDAPSRAEFVTVRASARDTVGNTVHQTVTRAFGLR